MGHQKNLKIISFVGLAGSGKSSAAEYLAQKGIPRISFGDTIRRAIKNAGIEQTEENERDFILHLIRKGQTRFTAEQTIPQIYNLINSGQHRIVADGSDTLDEHKTLLSEFPGSITTIAIVTPKHTRHHRLTERQRHPLTSAAANIRDWSEIEYEGKAGPIALADYYIVNDSHVENLYSHIDVLLEKIGFTLP